MRFFKSALAAGALILLLHPSLLAQYATPNSYWLSPQLTAPTAMSGYNYHQISAHYQKQGLAGNGGSRNLLLSGQFAMYGARNTQFGTLGLNVLRQENGASYLFATTGAMLSYNYTVRLTGQHHLVGGIQGGYFSRSIDWNKVSTRSQFDGGQINPDLDHGEIYSDYRSSAFTTNVGLAYYLTDLKGQQRFHAGVGLINANKGRFTYLENDDSQAEPSRWVAYSQLILINNLYYTLETKMFWQQQSGMHDFIGGLQLNKGINPRRTVADEHLGLGLFYSPDQSATLAMELARQNLLLGVSYTLPFGNKDLQGIQNAAEITVGWRMQQVSRAGNSYGSGNRGRMPASQSRRLSRKIESRSSAAREYKVNRKATRALKSKAGKRSAAGRSSKFSKRVSSYKSKAKSKRSAGSKANRNAGVSQKGRSGIFKKPRYKAKKVKQWKPKKRYLRNSKRRNR